MLTSLLQISWTHALRQIVTNCYKYHGREDLLPTFADEEAMEQADTKPPQGINIVNGATHIVAAANGTHVVSTRKHWSFMQN